jgi:hypothetical protein
MALGGFGELVQWQNDVDRIPAGAAIVNSESGVCVEKGI